ncbi:hypothetical protein Droror1_Dr00022304 [Drosera rotundifolia]
MTGSVVLDIPDGLTNITKQSIATGLEIERQVPQFMGRNCKVCVDCKVAAYGGSRRSLVYRPAMLSMVAIAAVCVCVALLFKSLPEVVCVFEPFRWETLEYGSS